jgi:hypothetical protein
MPLTGVDERWAVVPEGRETCPVPVNDASPDDEIALKLYAPLPRLLTAVLNVEKFASKFDNGIELVAVANV